jgi:hypothetical protein
VNNLFFDGLVEALITLSVFGKSHEQLVEVSSAQTELEIEQLRDFSEQNGVAFNLFRRNRLQQLFDTIREFSLDSGLCDRVIFVFNETSVSIDVVNS